MRIEISSIAITCGGRRPRTLKRGLHGLLFQCLDRMPIKVQLFGDRLERSSGTTPIDVPRKALGIKRIVGEEIQLVALHLAAASALDAPDLELEIAPRVVARQVSDRTRLAIVPVRMQPATGTAACFFERRTSVMTRAPGSPNTPRTVVSGRNPMNAYVSHRWRLRVRLFAIWTGCQKLASLEPSENPWLTSVAA